MTDPKTGSHIVRDARDLKILQRIEQGDDFHKIAGEFKVSFLHVRSLADALAEVDV